MAAPEFFFLQVIGDQEDDDFLRIHTEVDALEVQKLD